MTDVTKPSLYASATGVVRKLQEGGYTAYFAGGSVRDQLLGRTVKDYDIATSARPEQVVKLFPKSRRVGAAFGVILVYSGGHAMEVATFRTDGIYTDGRRPADVTFSTAEQDALRRDFSCNGLFFNPHSGEILDFVGGRRDISDKLLRAIGNPLERFAEDHLRMLRAVRFAARLEFNIHPDTWNAMRTLAPNLRLISRERIGQEMRFMLTHPTRGRAAELLLASGLMGQALGDVYQPQAGLAAEHATCPHVRRMPPAAGFAASLAALLFDIAPATAISPALAGNLQNALVLSGQERADIVWFLEKLPVLGSWRSLRVAAIKRLMADLRFSELRDLYQVTLPSDAPATELRIRLEELARDTIAPPPLVTGNDLLQMGAPAGPHFRRWLDELYDRQLENNFPDQASAMAAARLLIDSVVPK